MVVVGAKKRNGLVAVGSKGDYNEMMRKEPGETLL